jgi:hypothetical protein
MDESLYQPAKAMSALLKLKRVQEALAFLAAEGVVRPEAVLSGCRIFVKKNPCINEHFERVLGSEEDK